MVLYYGEDRIKVLRNLIDTYLQISNLIHRVKGGTDIHPHTRNTRCALITKHEPTEKSTGVTIWAYMGSFKDVGRKEKEKVATLCLPDALRGCA